MFLLCHCIYYKTISPHLLPLIRGGRFGHQRRTKRGRFPFACRFNFINLINFSHFRCDHALRWIPSTFYSFSVLMALLSCPNYRPGPSLRHISGERLFIDRFILLKSADKCNSYRQMYIKKWYYGRKKRNAR